VVFVFCLSVAAALFIGCAVVLRRRRRFDVADDPSNPSAPVGATSRPAALNSAELTAEVRIERERHWRM
jgi:hypothetical protein